MAVYNASKMAAGVQPRVLPVGQVAVLSTLALTAALLLNDTINIMNLEAAPDVPSGLGPTIMGMVFDSDSLDTGGGGATLSFDLGDANSAARFMSAVTNARAGGVQGPNVAGTYGYQPFAASFGAYPTASLSLYTLVLKCHAAANAWQNGTIRVKCEYTYDP